MDQEQLLQLEQELSFDQLRHEDLHQIAESIVNRVRTEKLGRVGIRVVVNGLLIYQYLMDGKEEDHWLLRKQRTVEAFGHSGLYIWKAQKEEQKYESYMEDERYALCGGGFPILVKGNLTGSFCVSGLAHEMDHQLIVDAIRNFQKEKTGGGEN